MMSSPSISIPTSFLAKVFQCLRRILLRVIWNVFGTQAKLGNPNEADFRKLYRTRSLCLSLSQRYHQFRFEKFQNVHNTVESLWKTPFERLLRSKSRTLCAVNLWITFVLSQRSFQVIRLSAFIGCTLHKILHLSRYLQVQLERFRFAAQN